MFFWNIRTGTPGLRLIKFFASNNDVWVGSFVGRKSI